MTRPADFGWGDPEKMRMPDRTPGIAPSPFYDDTGFPIPLVRVRDQIRERGGEINRDGDRWVIAHSDPDLVSAQVQFYPDGYVVVRVTDDAAVENSAETSYEISAATGRTWLEDLILGIINGGYTETAEYNKQGELLKTNCAVDHDGGQDVGFGRGVTTGERVSVAERTYPAWPTTKFT